MFREGQWLELRSFLLKQRANVKERLEYIENELDKIGDVTVVYVREDENDVTTPMTEQRKGIIVEENTSLSKMIKAYVAKGGNPFDISMFLKPDFSILKELMADGSLKDIPENEYTGGEIVEVETQPYDGVVFPKSEDRLFAIISEAGLLPIWKDPYRKLGLKKNIWDEKLEPEEALIRTKSARKWVSKEIKELRNNIEAKIIKLCDLKEQLNLEKKEIIAGCVGGFSDAEIDLDLDRFLKDRHLAQIIEYFDSQFFQKDKEGKTDFSKRVPPPKKIEQYKDIYLEDAPDGSEKYTTL
jgi:hypothetical protein